MVKDVEIEVLLIGTGTSSQTPAISCLTAPEGKGCACCRSTLTPEGRKNIRRNTSALLKIRKGVAKGGKPKRILIDAGKSFAEAAREHFPKHGVRELDAVLLTHPHADAINGLDDLRAWTLGGVIQPSISVYCNAYTYGEIKRMFPYMISESERTGGGDVPAFEWNIIEDDKPFNLFGVRITPLPVHHGAFFGQNPRPYICLAFLFDTSVCYLADVSFIPDSTWKLIESTLASAPLVNGGPIVNDASHNIASSDKDSGESAQVFPTLPILVVDCLRLKLHCSHFGLAQALQTTKRFNAKRSYIMGFTHRVSHDAWVHACEALGRAQAPKEIPERDFDPQPQGATSALADGINLESQGENWKEFTERALKEVWAVNGPQTEGVWVRPAYDGITLATDGIDGWDDGYS